MLADLGADVIKVERKGTGDDTRGWGPPFIEGKDGKPIGAAYFHSANRGKRSIELDFESEDGQRIVRKLAARSDVLIENFKVGGLAKFGLDYESLAAEMPAPDLLLGHRLRPGRALCQARRLRPDGAGHGRLHGPHRHRRTASRPASAFRCPTSSPASIRWSASSPRCSERETHRQGRLCRYGAGRFHGRRAGEPGAELSRLRQRAEAHRQCAREHRAVSGVPDRRRLRHRRDRQRPQYVKFCNVLGAPELGQDPDYKDNVGRLKHREELVGKLSALTQKMQRDDLLAKLEARRRAGRTDQQSRAGVRRSAGEAPRHATALAERRRQEPARSRACARRS